MASHCHRAEANACFPVTTCHALQELTEVEAALSLLGAQAEGPEFLGFFLFFKFQFFKEKTAYH